MKSLQTLPTPNRPTLAGLVRSRRGFTLIELMITILLSAIVVGGVYAMYTVSVQAYRTQDHAIEAQSNLRRGLAQLRIDLRSAAFNAPANSDAEPWVEVVGITDILTAVQVEVDPNTPVHEDGINDAIAPQMLTLLGSYDSQLVFRTLRIDNDKVTIEWDQTEWRQADFDRVFNTNNLARLEFYGAAKNEQFIPIASVEAFDPSSATQTFTLASAPQDIEKLGLGAGHEVSIAGYVRYRLQQDTKRDADSAKYDLIRERLDPRGNAVAGSWLTIAEYVVDLQFYDLCYNEAAPISETTLTNTVTLQCYPTLAGAQAGGQGLDPGVNNASPRLRSLKVKLATRSPFEDPNMPFSARANVDVPLRAYEVTPEIFGAARVFEATATVFMTSLQARRP